MSELENTKIEHKHILHKGIWISSGLVLVVILLIVGWANTYASLVRNKENDIKYRYLKVFGNEGLVKLSIRIDSLYRVDNDNFSHKVNMAEQELAAIADSVSLSVHRLRKNKPKNRN